MLSLALAVGEGPRPQRDPRAWAQVRGAAGLKGGQGRAWAGATGGGVQSEEPAGEAACALRAQHPAEGLLTADSDPGAHLHVVHVKPK